MSGHSKWSKIKRKKGAADQARAKVFSRRIKEITVAVKEGDSNDPGFNPRLRTAILNAKGDNMPKETIDRAIKKASETGGANFLDLTYEGYAPGGIALFVECTTDNTNRTVANVRAAFSKYGGSLATNGSVVFLFDRKAEFVLSQGELDEDSLTMDLIDAGAEDVELDDGEFTVTTEMEDFGNMQKKLEDLGIEPLRAELLRIPKTTNAVDVDMSRKVLKLVEIIDDLDDVNAVFHNMELTDDILADIDS